MVTRFLLEQRVPTPASKFTRDQELPDRVMRHPALTHCCSHTHKNPETLYMQVVRGADKGLWRPEKRVTLSRMAPQKELLKPLKKQGDYFQMANTGWTYMAKSGTHWWPTDTAATGQVGNLYFWHAKKTHWNRGQILRILSSLHGKWDFI